MANSITAGMSANLFYGYRPAWDPNGSILSPFFSPSTAPLESQTQTSTPSDFQLWTGTPLVTLHSSAQSLLSAVYKYDVLPVSYDPQNIDVPSGPLSLDDADHAQALATAGQFLGVDLTQQTNFMLVTFERCNATVTGDYPDASLDASHQDYFTAAAREIVNALPPATAPDDGSVLYDSKLTAADAQAYLSAISELGTHFVTQVSTGDKLIQVFVYGDSDFEFLQTQFAAAATVQPDGSKAVSGSLANSWVYYTSPKSNGGMVQTYGGLTTISRDPHLSSAIGKGDWSNGYVPDGTASIFAATQNYALLSALQQVVTYACRLTPIADLLPNSLVSGPWDRLVAGGLMQKFGSSVVVPLRRPLDYDWSSIFPQSTESWASGIATPKIDIYQERIDLAKVQLNGADIIGDSFPMQYFSSFSQVLQASTAKGSDPISLPSDSITIIAQIIDTTQAVQTPVLSMSTKALQQMTVACQDMYGALIFQTDDGATNKRKTALDGFLLETASAVDPQTKRYSVELASVITDSPCASVLADHAQSVQFSVVAGEALLQAQGPNADTVKELEVAYLNWLARIIPEDTDNSTLSNARVRSLYLANSVADFGVDSVFVPYVTYDSYSDYVGDLVKQATTLSGQIASSQQELTTTVASFKVMDSIETVNENVKSIGGVLTKYFQVLADGRQSMDGYYDSILAQLDTQLQSTLTDITTLQGQLGDQQKIISNQATPIGIVQKFEQDYIKYEEDEIFKAVMGIVTGLFDLGVAFAGVPEEAEDGVLKALKALKEVYEKLQSVMEVIEQLSAIEGEISEDITQINELASSIQSTADGGTLQMPSQVDMEMIPNNVEAALAGVPDNSSLQQDKANLIAAVKNLSIIGTALLNAQSNASQILVEINNNQRLKTTNSQQQADMEGLTTALNLTSTTKQPNLAEIDLIGMTGQLQFQLKQVLSTLASTLENQNGALEYTYFGQPATITSFSMNNLLSVISQQDSNIIAAIEQLNPQPQKIDDPITVKVSSVAAKNLINGGFLRFSVHASDPGFLNFVMVRIDRVIPRIVGVKSTDSGNYEVSLDTQARPFMDRDTQRKDRTFISTRRAFGPFVYDIETGKAKFGTNTGIFYENETHITPFTNWNISLPTGATNKNIAFDELLVDIEVDFYITAIYSDPAESIRKSMCFAATPGPVDTALVAAAVPDSTPGLSYLEGEMYQNQAVLSGWDAAFSMLVGPVNAFLNQQFQAYIKTLQPGDDSNLMKIQASYFGTATPIRVHGHTYWTSQATKINIDLSNPLIQFVANADQATVQQYIESGEVSVGSVDVTGDTSSPFIPADAYLPAGPLTFTADTATNELVIAQADVLGKGLGSIYLSTSGTLPAPLLPGDPDSGDNEYYIVDWSSTGDETRIKLSSDPAGTTPLTLTDTGSGIQTLTLSVTWADPAVVDTSKSPYVYANVQLSTLQGKVAPPTGQGDKQDTLSVVLDFPAGSFVLRNIHVKPPNWDPDQNATQISNAIANYYAQNEIKYIVQTINTTNLAADEALTPTQFVLHAMKTNAGNNVLQLLIATTGKVQNAHSLTLTEPVAYNPAGPVAGSSDFMVSLMVSSELTFEHIFVDSFNKNSTNFVVEAVAPAEGFQAWKAEMKSGTVTAPVPFDDSYEVDGTKTQFRITASSNDLTWDMTGLTFSRTQSNGISLDYTNGTMNPPTGGTTVNFQYRQYVYSGGQYGHYYWTGWDDASAVAYVTMSGNYPLEVVSKGTNQEVKFSTTNPVVDVSKSSDLKPTAACHCDDNDLKIALLSALSSSVPAQLQENMNKITFKPVSTMALESLLFPADQLISMGVANVPSAMLVAGSFLSIVRQKNANYSVTIPASAGAKGDFGGTTFQSGTVTNSVTRTGMPASFDFTYGPIDSAMGGLVKYTIDIEKGTISPALIAVVFQPDTNTTPQDVTLLLPGYQRSETTS